MLWDDGFKKYISQLLLLSSLMQMNLVKVLKTFQLLKPASSDEVGFVL